MAIDVDATLTQSAPLDVRDPAVLASVEAAVAKLGETVAALSAALTVTVNNHPAAFPLPAEQVAALTPPAAPAAPSDYPIPAAQLAELKPPAEFPIPAAQVAALSPQRDALTASELGAALPLDVRDDYAATEPLETQAGADGVLTFTATGGGQLVWVDVDPVDPADTTGYTARATVDGSEPTPTRGWVCRPGPSPIPVATAGVVKVWAPASVNVAVQVIRR